MKKSLIGLSLLVMLTPSAYAYTLVNNQDSGTNLEFLGSARLMWRSSSDKVTPVNAPTTRNHINHAVANNGSRFGFRLSQQLGQDFYAIGRVEWRFRGTAASQHNFDDIYARQLYAGIGHKQYGELTYGNMTTVTDEVKRTDLANTLSLSDGLLNSASRKVVQYTYKGIEGLKLGVFYGGKSKRNNNGLTLNQARKDVWGGAAIYQVKLDERQGLKFGAGISRERFGNINPMDTTAYAFGTAYTFDRTTLGVDLERSIGKNQAGDRRTRNEVRVIVHQRLQSDINAYMMYAYKTNKLTSAQKPHTMAKSHQYMIGAEYYIVPSYLKTFVEWQTSTTNQHTSGVKTAKIRNNQTVIGLRAYW